MAGRVVQAATRPVPWNDTPIFNRGLGIIGDA